MTRIISGQARGARLEVPPSDTRPTSDRVRESLFGALESADAIQGARVLDLYAGSGALALEALSRGAASVDLVESGRRAADIVQRNIATVIRASGTSTAVARVHQCTVRSFLARATDTFNLVFSDPPYDLDDESMTADLIALAPRLSPEGLVVVERARRSAAPEFGAASLVALRDRSYGDTTLWWAEPGPGGREEIAVQPATESQSR